MSAKKRRPEFELGPLLINQVQDYLGVRVVNKLTNEQASAIAFHCNDVAGSIGKIIAPVEVEPVDPE